MLNECLDSRCVINRYSYCSIGMSDAAPRALELGAANGKGPAVPSALLACNRPYKTYKDYGTHWIRANDEIRVRYVRTVHPPRGPPIFWLRSQDNSLGGGFPARHLLSPTPSTVLTHLSALELA